MIAPERVESFLEKLDVDALWGVGPVTANRLRERGIHRLLDVRTADPDVLRAAVGSMADWLLKLAAGEDDRRVEPNRPSKSSSSECTYAQDLTDLAQIREEVAVMARDNVRWLRRRGCSPARSPSKCATTTSPPSRAATPPPTDDADEIVRRAVRCSTRPTRHAAGPAAGRRRAQLRDAGGAGGQGHAAVRDG